MATLLNQPTGLPEMEARRDGLALRLERLCHERDPQVVEGFIYIDPARASSVRGRIACSLLRQIDDVNAEICRVIAPGFVPHASEGFSDRVLAHIRATCGSAGR